VEAFEVLVIGGGIAGLTAGLFAARAGRSVAVLAGSQLGGHLVTIAKIDDFPGFPEGVPGYDLCPIVEEQATAAGATVRLDDVVDLQREDSGWVATTGAGTYRAGAVIVATGSRLKGLGLGEERLLGKGVSDCASCDGPLFRGKTVGVVGGGDSALQEALELSKFASEVLVFLDQPAPTAQGAYRDAVLGTPSITLRAGTRVTEVHGDTKLEALTYVDVASDESQTVELAGLFPFVGLVPRTELLQGIVELDDDGHVPTDGSMRTAVPGLFAAGDIRRDSARQAVTAAGDGATAALAAHQYLAGG
jgi:thioredoxin reductase (NADPH)